MPVTRARAPPGFAGDPPALRSSREDQSMARDQQGLTLAGGPDSAGAFDRAMADYYGLTGDPVGVLKSALARDPGFALGGVAIAALTMIGGFRGDHPEVMSALRAAEAGIGRASRREKNHLAAAKAWARGEFSQAILGWERILADYPTDALALRLVQDAYFFLGRAAPTPPSPRRGRAR